VNFLTFIFSILLVLSFGVLAIQEKLSGGRRLRTTYLGHTSATRKLLSKSETETYQSFSGTYTYPTEKSSSQKKHTPRKPKINPECARLNLHPLIQEGREAHPILYELTAKLLKTFYGEPLLANHPRAEYAFLDLLLKKLATHTGPLEKLTLGDPHTQALYYKMLKGTKNGAYPSLLDYILLEENPSKICLSHAHPDLIALFFGRKAADRMFDELHKKKPPAITKEWIEQICSESHLIALDPNLLALLEFGRPKPHPKRTKTTWIAEDDTSHISLRKTIYRPPSI